VLVAGSIAGCAGSDPWREPAARLLARPTTADLARLRELSNDPDRDVRALALRTLAGLSAADPEALALERLQDPDAFVRAAAVRLLGERRAVAQLERVADRLRRDPDPVTRQRAAEALAAIGGGPAIEGLVRGLDDPLATVRAACVGALRVLRSAEAAAALARVLREDGSWEVRAEAAAALGSTGDPAVAADLESALADENEFVRAAALSAARELRRALERGPRVPPARASGAGD